MIFLKRLTVDRPTVAAYCRHLSVFCILAAVFGPHYTADLVRLFALIPGAILLYFSAGVGRRPGGASSGAWPSGRAVAGSSLCAILAAMSTEKSTAFRLHPAELNALRTAAAKNGTVINEGDIRTLEDYREAVFMGLDDDTVANLTAFIETGAYPGMDRDIARRAAEKRAEAGAPAGEPVVDELAARRAARRAP